MGSLRAIAGRPATRRLAVGLTALLAGCQPLPHPFAGDLPPPGMLSLRDTAAVTVEPVAGSPRATAEKLAPAMIAALRKRDIAAGETANPATYRLLGQIRELAATAGTAVVVAGWELHDPKGQRIGERRARVAAPVTAWRSGSSAAVSRLATASAVAVASLFESKPPTEVAVPTIRLRFATVTGAPGNGDAVLRTTMTALLQRQGIAVVAGDSAPASLELDGEVSVGKPHAGKQQVRIAWHVKRPGGAEIGTVAQQNDVPAGLLDGPWGSLGYTIAQAAEPGVVALVRHGASPAPAR